MPFNLMEVIKDHFGEAFISKASSALEENGTAIPKALSAIIPIGLTGILNKATSGADGANEIFDKAKASANNLSAPPDIQAQDTAQPDTGMSGLFGNNQTAIVSAISRFAGIKNSSAASLMNAGLPAILGVLGSYAKEKDLSASGLSGYLASQKDQMMQAMPSELSSLAGSLGVSAADFPDSGKSGTLISSDDKPINRNNWVVPLLFIIIILGLLFYFSRSCNETKPSTAADADNAMIITPQHHSLQITS